MNEQFTIVPGFLKNRHARTIANCMTIIGLFLANGDYANAQLIQEQVEQLHAIASGTNTVEGIYVAGQPVYINAVEGKFKDIPIVNLHIIYKESESQYGWEEHIPVQNDIVTGNPQFTYHLKGAGEYTFEYYDPNNIGRTESVPGSDFSAIVHVSTPCLNSEGVIEDIGYIPGQTTLLRFPVQANLSEYPGLVVPARVNATYNGAFNGAVGFDLNLSGSEITAKAQAVFPPLVGNELINITVTSPDGNVEYCTTNKNTNFIPENVFTGDEIQVQIPSGILPANTNGVLEVTNSVGENTQKTNDIILIDFTTSSEGSAEIPYLYKKPTMSDMILKINGETYSILPEGFQAFPSCVIIADNNKIITVDHTSSAFDIKGYLYVDKPQGLFNYHFAFVGQGLTQQDLIPEGDLAINWQAPQPIQVSVTADSYGLHEYKLSLISGDNQVLACEAPYNKIDIRKAPTNLTNRLFLPLIKR